MKNKKGGSAVLRDSNFPGRLLLLGLLVMAILATLAQSVEQGKKPLTFGEMMKFRAIVDPVISDNGRWVAFATRPDRGDGDVRVFSAEGETRFTIDRGGKPAFSSDSRWLVASLSPKALDLEKEAKDRPKPGLVLLELTQGELVSWEKVEDYSFSADSSWLAYRRFKEEEKKEEKPKKGEGESAEPKLEMKEMGGPLILRHLQSKREIEIVDVLAYAFDEQGRYLAYTVASQDGKKNGLFCIDLKKEGNPSFSIQVKEKTIYRELTWEKSGRGLAFLASSTDEEGNTREASLWLWTTSPGQARCFVASETFAPDWVIPSKSKLTWSRDGKRLFFGLQPMRIFELALAKQEGPKEMSESDVFDLDRILARREVDVWHWNDPRIIPHQKKQWPRTKEKTYLAVVHIDSGSVILLADKEVDEVEIPENGRVALGWSDLPYLKELTWDGNYSDIYLIDIVTGQRTKILTHQKFKPTLSPNGNYLVYFRDGNWHLYDIGVGKSRNLTAALKFPFFDEENDLPGEAPPYGAAEWIEDESAVLLYDRYDIWKMDVRRAEAINWTVSAGRNSGRTFRLIQTDREKKFLKRDDKLLLLAYHNQAKNFGFYAASLEQPGVEKLLEEKKKYVFLAKAKKADKIIFTQESYEEFPDIWVSRPDFRMPRRLSDVNPQIKDFAWGSAEPVEWLSLDGLPLQGVLIKPGNYQPGQRYPVLVYFYEKFSQRLYEFNQVVVNHRPCFPLYASNGYAIFLPDIVYEVGRPGFSSTKCVVPGVQKLIDMGLADPGAIALHGHSWSGYQTAYIITQTNLFRAAIAGAAVANMTSAYSGIRWESGLARQWQYEKAQSRIGASLWEGLNRYIDNSPVFFADRIHTPLLLMFGDEDGAVPWEQGIELYLAMRRLGKECIFLQYRGEPHHPQKYANKLDYAIKMKEYLDHYLKGFPAPEWISKGIAYFGK